MKLTQTIVCELLDYNPETGGLIWKLRDRKWFTTDFQYKMWNAQFAGEAALTHVDKTGYLVGTVLNKRYLTHRVIWFWVTGKWPVEIDHINHIKIDNRWANLRETMRQGNARNMSLSRGNNSGHTGVDWRDDRHCWRARMVIDGRDVSLGHYDSLEEAIAARKAAEQKYGFHSNHGKA